MAEYGESQHDMTKGRLVPDEQRSNPAVPTLLLSGCLNKSDKVELKLKYGNDQGRTKITSYSCSTKGTKLTCTKKRARVKTYKCNGLLDGLARCFSPLYSVRRDFDAYMNAPTKQGSPSNSSLDFAGTIVTIDIQKTGKRDCCTKQNKLTCTEKRVKDKTFKCNGLREDVARCLFPLYGVRRDFDDYMNAPTKQESSSNSSLDLAGTVVTIDIERTGKSGCCTKQTELTRIENGARDCKCNGQLDGLACRPFPAYDISRNFDGYVKVPTKQDSPSHASLDFAENVVSTEDNYKGVLYFDNLAMVD